MSPSGAVETELRFMAPLEGKPQFFLYQPSEGTPQNIPRNERKSVAIRDARSAAPAASLDVEGFQLVRHQTDFADFYAADAVRERYYPQVERLVRETTGAARALAFDHNVRCATKAERGEDGAQMPVRFAHNDYTERSGPQRVRDLLPDEADRLLERRLCVVNVWRPITGPVLAHPLAFCDARTLGPGDLVPTDLCYRDRTGEVQSVRFSPDQRWYYFPRMQQEEALLLKCYDSASDGRARFTAHTAFEDPTTPPDAPARESIEVRTLVFF